AHDQGTGHRGAVAVRHAAQHVAVGHAGGDEVAVLGVHEVVGGEDLRQVVAGVDGLLTLGVVLWPQLPQDLATHALHGGGGDDTLRGATDTHHDVHGVGGVVLGSGDRTGDVAVTDQSDLRASLADLADQVVVARAVQNHDGDFLGGDALGLRDDLDVVGCRCVQLNQALSLRADGDLL